LPNTYNSTVATITMPQVSIIIPAYNRSALISETLDSVLQQNYADWECLVVDDHSTDDTKEIIADYALKDNRIKYILNKRSKGAQGARNTGVDEANGKYLIFLDSDDLLAGNCLYERLKFADQSDDFDFYCFATAVFASKPGDTNLMWNYINADETDLIRFLQFDIPWHTSGVLWKKQTVTHLNGWDEKLSCWQDWDIHIRAVADKSLKYLKADNNSVDTYYRKDDTTPAISKLEKTVNSVKTKMYLIDKVFNLLSVKNANQRLKLTFARMTYRIADDVNKYLNKKEARAFITKYLSALGYKDMYTKSWSFYLNYRRDLGYPKSLRKLLDVIPALYKNESLFATKTTYLKAVVQNTAKA
jgi:glycosyltransferase involved in cell wall biosynthesis